MGVNCFQNACNFVIDSLPCLESVKIGNACFSMDCEEVYGNGLLRITNCCNLLQLEIENESCANFNRLELYNLSSLQSIRCGDNCCENIRIVVLDSLPNLESVNIGNESFYMRWTECNDGIFQITNCPNLRQLEIGDDSFYDFKSIQLSNLNSLQSIKFGDYCFFYADLSLKGE